VRVGLHVRVSGGYGEAVEHVRAAGGTAMQIFSSNPRSYRTSQIDRAALARFRDLRAQAGIAPCAIHTPYLVNLASDDPKISSGSVGLVRHDLAVAAAGGIALVNTHLGSYGSRDRRDGFTAVCRALERVLEGVADGVMLVLENSAGAGNLAGGSLDELGEFLRALQHPQLGVCLDTAHAWAAGYAIDTPEGVERFLSLADEHVGIGKIPLFHFNDTEVPLGGARDRHWHIGEGNIGFNGFRALLAQPQLADKTAILETPGEDADDVRNVQTVLAIARGAAAART
jgi:deoxyribonuclease-4